MCVREIKESLSVRMYVCMYEYLCDCKWDGKKDEKQIASLEDNIISYRTLSNIYHQCVNYSLLCDEK